MNAKVRAHLTYANVVSTLCLFILLGGSAYATAKIGSKQIKDNSIQSKDIKNNTVAGKDVKNGSLAGTDFKSGELPRGATGATGARGATGPRGPGVGPTEATHFLTGNGTANCATASPTGVFCHNDTSNAGTSSNAGSPAAPAGYFIDRSGVVHLQGTIAVNCSGIPTDCDDLTAMFILPPGYRPSGGERYFGVDPATDQVVVRPDGRVKANVGHRPLDAISFRP